MLTRTRPSADCQEPGWEPRWAAGAAGDRADACMLAVAGIPGTSVGDPPPRASRPRENSRCPSTSDPGHLSCPAYPHRACQGPGVTRQDVESLQDRPGAGSDMSREPAAPSGGTRTPRVLALLRHVSCCPLPPQADTGKQGRLGPPLHPPHWSRPRSLQPGSQRSCVRSLLCPELVP